MKMKIYACLTGLMILFAGCGAGDPAAENKAPETKGGETIAVKFDEKQISFEPTYAKFATFKKGLVLTDKAIGDKNERVEAVVHRIYLANYDLKLTDPSKQDFERISSDGQFRVEIQIEAEKGALENAPLKAQVYEAKAEPFGRVSWINTSRFDDGKDSNSMIGGSKAAGTVKITSVSDAEIAGEIDFSDSDGRVQGKFTAQRLK